jgi:hypothetical protein
VLSPRPGANVHANFTVSWSSVPDARAYEVRIIKADGDLLWHKRVTGTSVQAPPLRTGEKYFLTVRAFMPDGQVEQGTPVAIIGG